MSEINIYFNKNTKKLEEKIKLKKIIVSPEYSFIKQRARPSNFQISPFPIPPYPGPGFYSYYNSYRSFKDNKLISTFDENRGFRMGKAERFKKLYKNKRNGDESTFKKFPYNLRKEEKYFKINYPKTPGYRFSYSERFKQEEKIDYNKYKSLYI